MLEMDYGILILDTI